MKLHTGDKNYKCALCDAAFSRFVLEYILLTLYLVLCSHFATSLLMLHESELFQILHLKSLSLNQSVPKLTFSLKRAHSWLLVVHLMYAAHDLFNIGVYWLRA